MRAIELADVGRAYGERIALAGVTLDVEEGETLAVFGSNGAGKTTLLRILATLLKPHHGVARVLGKQVPREGWAVRGRLGFLGPRAAALPGPDRAREPALPRAAARRPVRPHRRVAGGGRDADAGRRSRAHVLARDAAAHRGLPRGAARAGPVAARRAAGGAGPGRGGPGGAADLERNPRGDLPRRRARAGRGGPGAGPARRAGGAARAGGRGHRRRRAGRCTHEAGGLGADPQGRAPGAAQPGVGAGDGPVLAQHLRPLSFRAGPEGGLGRARLGDPAG